MTTTTAIEGQEAGRADAAPALQGGHATSPDIFTFTVEHEESDISHKEVVKEEKEKPVRPQVTEDDEIERARAEVRRESALTELRMKALAQRRERARVEEEILSIEIQRAEREAEVAIRTVEAHERAEQARARIRSASTSVSTERGRDREEPARKAEEKPVAIPKPASEPGGEHDPLGVLEEEEDDPLTDAWEVPARQQSTGIRRPSYLAVVMKEHPSVRSDAVTPKDELGLNSTQKLLRRMSMGPATIRGHVAAELDDGLKKKISQSPQRYKGFREKRMSKWSWGDLVKLARDRENWESVFPEAEREKAIEYFVTGEVMTAFTAFGIVKARAAGLSWEAPSTIDEFMAIAARLLKPSESEAIKLLKAGAMVHATDGNWTNELVDFLAKFVNTCMMLDEDLDNHMELFAGSLAEPLRAFAVGIAKQRGKDFNKLFESCVKWCEAVTRGDSARGSTLPTQVTAAAGTSSAATTTSGTTPTTSGGARMGRGKLVAKATPRAKVGAVTDDQRKMCLALNLCFRCGKPGHAVKACKEVIDPTKPRSGSDDVYKALGVPLQSLVGTVGKWQPPTPAGGTAPVPVSIAVFAMGAVQLPKILEEKEFWNTIKMDELGAKRIRLKVIRPIKGIDMTKRVDAIEAWILDRFEASPAAQGSGDGPATTCDLSEVRTMKIVERGIIGSDKTVNVWVDSGSRANLISDEYARCLDLKMIEGPKEISITGPNQTEIGRSRRFTVINMDFSKWEAPSKKIPYVVTKRFPGREFMIVGETGIYGCVLDRSTGEFWPRAEADPDADGEGEDMFPDIPEVRFNEQPLKGKVEASKASTSSVSGLERRAEYQRRLDQWFEQEAKETAAKKAGAESETQSREGVIKEPPWKTATLEDILGVVSPMNTLGVVKDVKTKEQVEEIHRAHVEAWLGVLPERTSSDEGRWMTAAQLAGDPQIPRAWTNKDRWVKSGIDYMRLDRIKIGKKGTLWQREVLHDMLWNRVEAFQVIDQHPCKLDPIGIEFVKEYQNINEQLRHIRPEIRDKVNDILRMYAKIGIIVPSASETAMAIVSAYNRSSGKVRVCINAPPLNAQVKTLPSQVPLHEEIHLFLAGKEWIVKYDGTSGYLQVGVKMEARKFFAITTPLGHFEYTRMPFGFVNAGAHYQRIMEGHIAEFAEHMVQFIDDTVQANGDFVEHIAVSDAYMAKCVSVHYLLNPEKCEFLCEEINCLGFLSGPHGQRIDSKRLEAIRNLAVPTSPRMVRREMGMCQFLSRFVPELPRMADPLWATLEGGKKFEITAEARAAHEAIKEILLKGHVLVQRKPGGQLYGRADGSEIALAAVLYQDGPDEKSTGVLGFFSRKLKPSERWYTAGMLEARSLARLGECAMPFCIGNIIFIVDHKDLLDMHKSANPMLVRTWLSLARFPHTIGFAPGVTNGLCDLFSRCFDLTIEEQMAAKRIQETRGDQHQKARTKRKQAAATVAIPEVAQLPETVERNGLQVRVFCLTAKPVPAPAHDPAPSATSKQEDVHPDVSKLRFEIVNGVIGLAERAPPAVALWYFGLAHGQHHAGLKRTLEAMAETIKWPGMTADVSELWRTCVICQKVKAKAVVPAEMGSTAAKEVNESLFMDHMGPLREENGFKFLLVMVDRFSGFVIAVPVTDTTAVTTVQAFWDRWRSVFGVPRLMTSDGGPAFANAEFKDLSAIILTRHKITVPYAPEGHAPVECIIEQYRVGFRAGLLETHSWMQHVAGVSFGINNSVNRVTGVEPARIVFGGLPRSTIRAEAEAAFALVPDEETPKTHIARIIEEQRLIVPRVLEAIAKEADKQQLDQKMAARGKSKFMAGDEVIIKDLNPGKEGAPWIGPYTVEEDIGNAWYKVAPLCQPGAKSFDVNARDMHAFYRGCLTDAELAARAGRLDEFIIKEILGHKVQDKRGLVFRVLWEGYPDKGDDDDDSWVSWRTNFNNDKVAAYMDAHPDLKDLVKKLGVPKKKGRKAPRRK